MQIIWGLMATSLRQILLGSSIWSAGRTELAVERNMFSAALARKVMQVAVGKGVMLEPEGCLVGSVR